MKKRIWHKVISIALVLCLFITLIPDIGYATDTNVSEETAVTTESETLQNNEMKLQTEEPENPDVNREEPDEETLDAVNDLAMEGFSEEDVIEKTETTTVFDIGDGLNAKVFHGGEVRFEDEDGELVDYDPSLVKIKDGEKTDENTTLKGYEYRNNTGDKKQYLPEKLSEKTPVIMEYNGNQITITPTDDTTRGLGIYQSAVSVENEIIPTLYEGEGESVPVNAVYGSENDAAVFTYTSGDAGIKETITLKTKPETNTFTYEIYAGDLTVKENILDEGLTFIDPETDDIIAGIDAPWMNDATGEAYSTDITYELEKIAYEEGLYLLTMTIDEEYLSSEEREYPVTVDPSVTWKGNDEIRDTYIITGSGYASTNFYETSNTKMPVGKNSTGTHRSLFKILNLKSEIEGMSIESAKLTLYESGTGASGQIVRANRILEDWSPSTVTWNDQPERDTEKYIAQVTTSGTKNTAKVFDFTNFARNISNGTSNFGVMLRNVTDTMGYACFWGSRYATTSYRPKLVVTYHDGPTDVTSAETVKYTSNTGEYTPTQHFYQGRTMYVSWSGANAYDIDAVQYKFVGYTSNDVVPTNAGTNGNIDLTTYRSTGKASASATNVSLTGTPSLPPGKFKLYLRVKDAAGNTSSGKPLTVYVDGEKPTINSVTLSPEAGKITSVTNPTVNWNVSDTYFDYVKITVNGTEVKTVSSASGSFSIPSSYIKDGDNTIKVTAYDKAVNTSSKNLSYLVDVIAPVIEEFSTIPNSSSEQLSNNSMPTLSWKVTEQKIEQVDIYINDEKISDSSITPSVYSYTLKENTLKDSGEYRFRIKVTDSVGLSDEKEIIYCFDNEKPVISKLSIEPKTLFKTSGNRSPKITFKAVDSNFKCIMYSMDGITYSQMSEGSAGVFKLPSNCLSKGDGTYTIYIKAVDKAGNESDVKELTYKYKAGGDYIPHDIEGTEYYGKRMINWTLDAYDPNLYRLELHRSTTPGFTPSNVTLICEDLDASMEFYADNELLEGTSYYRIVVKDISGAGAANQITSELAIESSLSASDLKNTLGVKGYLSYTSFDTPVGNGYIEESSGNFMYEQTDFEISGPQLDYSFSRTYNSQADWTSMLGTGWMDSYHKELFKAGNDMYFVDSDGSCYRFTETNNTYTCDETKDHTLKTTSDGYSITTKDDVVYTFNSFGQLTDTEGPNGSNIMNFYDEKGRLMYVTSGENEIWMTYDEDSYLLQSVRDLAETTYSFTYSDQSLTDMTAEGSVSGEETYRYGYAQDKGDLTQIYDGEDNCYTVSYTGEKAVSAIYPDGERLDLTYMSGETKIERKYVDGSGSSQKIFEEKTNFDEATRKIISHTDPKGRVTRYTYGIEGYPYLVTKVQSVKGYQTVENGTVVFHEVSSVTESEFTYDSNENVIKETDSNGAVTTYTYDEENNLKSETTVDSGVTVTDIGYSYDENGNLTKEDDQVKNTQTKYGYDQYGNEISTEEIDSGVTVSNTVSSYDADGNLLSETTAEGTIETGAVNIYDPMGRVTKSVEKGIETVTEYDFLGRAVKVTTKESGKADVVKTYQYNGNGTLIYESDSAGVSKSYTYDSRNRNLTEKTYSADVETRTQSTVYGFEKDVTVRDGRSARTENITYTQTKLDSDGNQSSKEYIDVSGNTVRSVYGTVSMEYSYDGSGNQVAAYKGSTDPADTSYELSLSLYDERGNNFANISKPGINSGNYVVISNGTENDSIVTYTEHNVTGTVKNEQDGEGNNTAYQYNEKDDITKCTITGSTASVMDEVSPGENEEQPGPNQGIGGYAADLTVSYDRAPNGNLITTYGDKRSNSRVEMMNAAGLLVQTKDVGETEDELLFTNYEYDTGGRLIEKSFSDDTFITYSYYGDSERVSEQRAYRANGTLESRVEYVYDIADRAISIKCYEGENTDSYCHTEYEFDDEGKLVKEHVTYSDGDKQTTEYSYDTEGRVIEKDYPSDSGLGTVNYSYDVTGKLTAIHQDGDLAAEYSYNGLGHLETAEFYDEPGSSGKITANYVYDDFGRVEALEYLDGSTVLESFTYSYDLNNYISEMTHINNLPAEGKKINETKEYSYDEYGNLTESIITDHLDGDSESVTTYSFDAVGNRSTMTEDGVTTTYSYNGLNQLITQSGPAGTVNYSYDDRGNCISESGAGENITMTYAVTGEMKSLTKGSSFSQSNMYDHNGIRISRTENGTERKSYYDHGTVLFTKDGNNLSTANILDDTGSAVGTYRGDDYHSYLKDAQGSTTNIIREDGTLAAAYKYTDFGETAEITGSSFGNQICYTGGIYDENTGFYYLNARYYDPEIGRFISQDTYRGTPEESKQWHLYVYCASNPINYTDLSGHKPKKAKMVTRSKTVKYALKNKASISVKIKWKHNIITGKVKISKNDVNYSKDTHFTKWSAFYLKQISSIDQYKKSITIRVALGLWKIPIPVEIHSGTKPWSMMTMEIKIRGNKAPWVTTKNEKPQYDTVKKWGWPILSHPY